MIYLYVNINFTFYYFCSEGEEWRQSRSVIDKKLLRLKDVSRYTDRMNEVDTSFINLVKKEWAGDQHGGEISCLRYQLYKWSFESKSADNASISVKLLLKCSYHLECY